MFELSYNKEIIEGNSDKLFYFTLISSKVVSPTNKEHERDSTSFNRNYLKSTMKSGKSSVTGKRKK